MKILTDGYTQFSKEKILLSGESTGAPKAAADIVAKLGGGSAQVSFAPIGREAIGRVEEAFGDVYRENDEGYIICMDDDVKVYANSAIAMIYAAYSILGHYENGIEKGIIYNYPCCEHRSARVFLPPKDEMPYFKNFIDMLLYLGYNTLVLEVGGCMEYKRHPEINEYWLKYSAEMAEFNGKTYYNQISKRVRNSVHTYNSGGDVYSQNELRELAAYCRERCMEIIPEIPSLTHSEYILGAHPELAECSDEYLPDTCCPQNEALYELVFDLYDEAIEVFHPKTLHIGHDEWWVMCVCDKCRGKDPAKLFADNVNRCCEYLAARGVETMLWGDKLVSLHEKTDEAQAGAYKKIHSLDKGRRVTLFGKECIVYDKVWFNPPDNIEEIGGIPHEFYDTSDCVDMLDPRVQVLDWSWQCEDDFVTPQLKKGIWTVYGNMEPTTLVDWKGRVAAGIRGISVSCWCQTDEIHMQKYPTLFEIGYGSLLIWNKEFDENKFADYVFLTAHDMYRFRNRDTLLDPHIEITHTSDEIVEKVHYPYPAAYVEAEHIKMGEYVVCYADGSEERVPVLFGSNIGLAGVSLTRTESTRFYTVDPDPQLRLPAAVCDYIKEGDTMWYKIALPAGKKVEKVTYVPLEEHKDSVRIKEIRLIGSDGAPQLLS